MEGLNISSTTAEQKPTANPPISLELDPSDLSNLKDILPIIKDLSA